MSTTMLSKCGGFVTRRNIQIQAKHANSPIESCSNRLQDQQQTTTLTATTTATTVTATCSRLSAHQPHNFLSCGNSSLLLIGVLVIILITSTAALPRRALGRHLILPHRHHVHLRSAGQEHSEHREHRETKATKCKIIEMNVTIDTLTSAIEVCNLTLNATKELLESYLNNTKLTLRDAEERYEWFSLKLDYPLKDEVKNAAINANDTKEPEEELTNILESLVKMQQLLNNVTLGLPLKVREEYFNHFKDKLEHNKFEVKNLLGKPSCDANYQVALEEQDHAMLEFGVVMDFIRLLNVIGLKYKTMLERITRQASN